MNRRDLLQAAFGLAGISSVRGLNARTLGVNSEQTISHPIDAASQKHFEGNCPMPLRSVQDRTVRRYLDGIQYGIIATGLRDLDHCLQGGLFPGDLVYLAGSSGIGKSSLALQIAHTASRTQQVSSLILCSPYRREGVASRLLDLETGGLLSQAYSRPDDVGGLTILSQQLPLFPMAQTFLLEVPNDAWLTIDARLEALFGRQSIDLIIVDAMPDCSVHRKFVDVGGKLKSIAQKWKIPILACVYVPYTHIVRDSADGCVQSEIAELLGGAPIADVLLFLDCRGLFGFDVLDGDFHELHIPHNRYGATVRPWIRLRFDGPPMRFISTF